MTANNNKSDWRSVLTVAGMAAAGTLAAKLVQVGVDAMFPKKDDAGGRRTEEWVKSARLMASVTRISMNTLDLAYVGRLETSDSIGGTLRDLRARADGLASSLDSLEAMSEEEFISFKFRIDALRADAAEFEKALRNAGLVEEVKPPVKETVEAIVITEERKEQNHVEAKPVSEPARGPESKPAAEPVTRTEEELA